MKLDVESLKKKNCLKAFTSTVTHSFDSISNRNSESAPNVISSIFGGIVIFNLVNFYENPLTKITQQW